MPPLPPKRTLFTTLLGILAILIGAPASLFSAFALMMAIGKPYANASTTLLDIFLLFILPPVTLLAGIGLLFRHRWARWWMILLATGLLGVGIKGVISPAPVEELFTPVAPVYAIPSAIVGGLLLLGLSTPRVRREFQPSSQAHPPPVPPPIPISAAGVAATTDKPSLIRQLTLPMATAAICLWTAWDGLTAGQIRKSSKFSAERRVATREEDPIYYWSMLGFISAFGGACAAYSAWLLAARLRPSA